MAGRRTLSDRSDEMLAGQWLDGHPDAFTALVHRYETPLYNFLRRMCGNGSDAEDLFQETFFKVYRYRERYDRQAPFKPWLYSIAANCCRDRLRWRLRRPVAWLSPTAAARIPARGEGTDGPARRDETRRRLEAALAALPVKHRTVFLLARYEGLAYGDIAESLGIPVGTVKSRMNHAVKFLMEALGHDG